MSKTEVLLLHWLPDGERERLAERHPAFAFLDGREVPAFERHHATAAIVYGAPPLERLGQMTGLRWVQLASAGVPQDLCPVAQRRGLTVTNLAGLYGPTIAEHALTLMSLLSRNLQVVLANQKQRRWDRSVAVTMRDLHGRTLAVIGLGNIGQAIARLARAHGMRVLGCRRTGRETPFVDRVYAPSELPAMLAQADVVAVSAPLTRHTQGLLGPTEFAALKPGALFVNVSRGAVAREDALLAALRLGQVGGAGLDVFAVEPLPTDHPFWDMPQVVVSPHYSGETVNLSSQPAQRLARNLEAWSAGRPLEGVVDLEWGY